MRSRFILLRWLLGFPALDWFVYLHLKRALPRRWRRLWFSILYWAVTLSIFASFWLAAFVFAPEIRLMENSGSRLTNIVYGAMACMYFPKLTFATVLLVGQGLLGIRKIAGKISDALKPAPQLQISFAGMPGWASQSMQEEADFELDRASKKDTEDGITRGEFLSRAGLFAASLPLFTLAHGIVNNCYDYQVRRRVLRLPRLPRAFEGFRLLQISDIHAGSLEDRDAVWRGIQMVMREKADCIVFTGDLVNNVASEYEPYADLFQHLRAPEGMFSTLGNHDYGEYVPWASEAEREANISQLVRLQEETGFTVLRNEHQLLERNGQRLAMVGVENWGKPPFPQLGDLDTASIGLDSETCKILLSHDPSHWDAQVRDHNQHFDLTLAGHTHGFQFGIEFGDFRWSPGASHYPRWADLYQEGSHFLYVNRGFGFQNFPGRIGILPEITVLELQRA